MKHKILSTLSVLKKDPVFILGNQKSGTTIIANLIAQATKKSLTSDFKSAIKNSSLQLELDFNLLSFNDFVQRYRYEFSKDLIKEPFLSYYIPQLIETFPKAKFILIVRNPFQNIRSILNRLEIPGDLENINFNDYDEIKKTPVWKLALQSNMFGLKSSNYIESMANRWNYVVNSYLSNSNNIVIVKYEEFLQNKADFIQRLIKDINLDYVQDIKYKTEIQYQKKGNSDVDLSKFFGDNYKKIERICKTNMNRDRIFQTLQNARQNMFTHLVDFSSVYAK